MKTITYRYINTLLSVKKYRNVTSSIFFQKIIHKTTLKATESFNLKESTHFSPFKIRINHQYYSLKLEEQLKFLFS